MTEHMTEPSMFEGFGYNFGERLKIIQAIGDTVPKVMTETDDEIQELAQLTVGNTVYQILNRELEHLASDMGVTLTAVTPTDKLAEVINILDGNRRKTRLR